MDADGLAQVRVQLQEQHQMQLQQLQQQLKQQPCSFPLFSSMFAGLGQGLATAPGQGLAPSQGLASGPGPILGQWLGQGQGLTQSQGRGLAAASAPTHGVDVMLGKRCRDEDDQDHDHNGGGGGGLSLESLSSGSDGMPHAPPGVHLANILVKKRLSQTNLMALSSEYVASAFGLSQDGKGCLRLSHSQSGTVPSVSDLDMETMTAGGSDVGSEGDVVGSGLGQGLGNEVGLGLGSDSSHPSHTLSNQYRPMGSSSSISLSLEEPYLDHPLPHLTWPSNPMLAHHSHPSQTYTHPSQSTYSYGQSGSFGLPPINQTLTQNHNYNSVLDFESMEMVSMLLSPCNQPGRNHSSSSNGSTGGLGLDIGLVHSQSTHSIHDHEAVSSLLGFYSHCQEESSQKDLLALEKQALEQQSLTDGDGVTVDSVDLRNQGSDEHGACDHISNGDNHSCHSDHNNDAIPSEHNHHDDGVVVVNGTVPVPVVVSCASTTTTDILVPSATTATTTTTPIMSANILCEEPEGFGLEI